MNHGSTLYNLGLSYYAYGTIKQGRKVQAYYYKLCKPATPEQTQALQSVFPHVTEGTSRAQYAPELRANVLIFPSKAEMKRKSMSHK